MCVSCCDVSVKEFLRRGLVVGELLLLLLGPPETRSTWKDFHCCALSVPNPSQKGFYIGRKCFTRFSLLFHPLCEGLSTAVEACEYKPVPGAKKGGELDKKRQKES